MVTLKDILILKTYTVPTLLKVTKNVHLTWSENCISAVSYVADARTVQHILNVFTGAKTDQSCLGMKLSYQVGLIYQKITCYLPLRKIITF
jgi:hypothetical protein